MKDEDKTKEQLINENELVEMRQRIAELVASETECKLAEEKLRKARDRAQKYLDVAEVIIIAVNDKEEVTLINQKGCKLLEYEEDEIIGKNWFNVFLPATIRAEVRTVFQKLIAGEIEPVEYYENPILTRSGEEKLIAWHNTVLTDEVGNITGTLSSGMDITERKRAEQMLRESKGELQAIMNNTTDAILVYDEHGSVTTINKEAQKLFCGNDKKELKSIWDIIPLEDKINFSDRLKSVKEGNKLLDYETVKILANGEKIPVSVGLVYIDEGAGRFIETMRDIRERVMVRNKIIELEKAQVIGKMAEGIAHHMGTPLASMLLKIQMLKEDISGVPEYAHFMEKLDSVEKHIFYSQKVIQRLFKFVNKPEDERRSKRVSTLLEEAVEVIKPLLKRHGIRFELCVDKDLKVLADGSLLGLVFVDVMMNAVDAMPEGGKLSIAASNRSSGELVDIVISDTGTGIPKEILPFVFDPFFTSKPAGKGTGLGLSVAKRIIYDHGGEIGIESTEGKGTSVWIKLPTYTEE